MFANKVKRLKSIKPYSNSYSLLFEIFGVQRCTNESMNCTFNRLDATQIIHDTILDKYNLAGLLFLISEGLKAVDSGRNGN